MGTLTKPEWDYSEHAAFYYARPNYSNPAIDELVRRVDLGNPYGVDVADIGAGTGNLSIMLAERGFHPVAVEPNLEMMNIGLARTKKLQVTWRLGTGEDTGLESSSVDWVCFGSSFNTTDRDQTLQESHRILRGGGWFTCMWNNRDLQSDPVQAEVEAIIRRHVPDYSHGTRREDQTDVISESGLFGAVEYLEHTTTVVRSSQIYLDGWRSVKNNHWDLSSSQGKELQQRILNDIAKALADREITMNYTTKIWSARAI